MSQIKKDETMPSEQVQTELSDSVEENAPRTKVKVAMTLIKFFNHDKNTVEEETIIGRLNMVECKKYVANMAEKNIFISKENQHEQFTVDSIALYQLKGV